MKDVIELDSIILSAHDKLHCSTVVKAGQGKTMAQPYGLRMPEPRISDGRE